MPAFLIAVQSKVRPRDMGAATAALQFSRNIGGALGVSVMGVALSWHLAARLAAAGGDPAAISLDRLLDPMMRTASSVVVDETLRNALAGALQGVFVIAVIAAALGLAVTALAPHGRIDQLGTHREGAEDRSQSLRTRLARE